MTYFKIRKVFYLKKHLSRINVYYNTLCKLDNVEMKFVTFNERNE